MYSLARHALSEWSKVALLITGTSDSIIGDLITCLNMGLLHLVRVNFHSNMQHERVQTQADLLQVK